MTTSHSPFDTSSFEPRFAVESPLLYDDRILIDALRLFLHCHGQRYSLGPTLEVYSPSSTRLTICTSRSDHFPRRQEEHLLQTFELEDRENALIRCAAFIRRWLLDRADYGEQPWFDGGEDRGYRLYYVAYAQEPSDFYGHCLVEPKWFEVHK